MGTLASKTRTTPGSLIAGVEYDGERLRALREQQGLTQTELGDKVDVSRMMIYLAESERASYRLLRNLAAILGVPFKSLLIEEL